MMAVVIVVPEFVDEMDSCEGGEVDNTHEELNPPDIDPLDRLNCGLKGRLFFTGDTGSDAFKRLRSELCKRVRSEELLVLAAEGRQW
jgi:hypothetical protein